MPTASSLLLLTTLGKKYRIPADSIWGRNHYIRYREYGFDLVRPQLAGFRPILPLLSVLAHLLAVAA